MVAKFKKNKRGSFRKDIFFSALLGILLLFVAGFLIFTNLKINQRRQKLISQIEALSKEIQFLEGENEKLKENISQAGSKEFLEEVAREQLGFKKPGEEVVVVTKEEDNEEKKEEEREEENKSWWERLKFWER
jgi:cell division protein FtsL